MVNRENYRLVCDFIKWKSENFNIKMVSIERYRFYLRPILLWADERFLGDAGKDLPSFPQYIAHIPGKGESTNLAAESQRKIIDIAKQFLFWAIDTHPSRFRGIKRKFVDLLHPMIQTPENESVESVTLKEVLQLIAVPYCDLASLRDKAAAAFLLCSGMRASAFVSLPIKAINLESKAVKQYPKLGVRTKNSKSAETFLMPIPELFPTIQQWDTIVRSTLTDDSPWFAVIENEWGNLKLVPAPAGLNRNHLLDRRLKILFDKAGLPYKSAHKFRHGHAIIGLENSKDLADYKAVSQNLMHSNIVITDQIYSKLGRNELHNRITNLVEPKREESLIPANSSVISNDQLKWIVNSVIQGINRGD